MKRAIRTARWINGPRSDRSERLVGYMGPEASDQNGSLDFRALTVSLARFSLLDFVFGLDPVIHIVSWFSAAFLIEFIRAMGNMIVRDFCHPSPVRR